MAGFYGAVRDKMGEHVERLLDRLALERRPEALIIVADTFLTWAVAAGARRGVPVCSLWTQPATFFLALYHLDRWPPVNGQDSDEELSTKSLEQYVPGLSSVRLSDLKIFGSMERSMKIVAEAFANLRKAQCVLFTSFLELEPRAFDTITESLPCPAYPIGPSIASLPLNGDGDKIGDEEHRDWLDAQPENSVLYVSFGSYVSMPASQFEEIAAGLCDSGVRFFWVAGVRRQGLGGAVVRAAGGVVPPLRRRLPQPLRVDLRARGRVRRGALARLPCRVGSADECTDGRRRMEGRHGPEGAEGRGWHREQGRHLCCRDEADGFRQ
ncbi:hypothetical protein ACQ4PT_039042 [Festuca glaucescens]